MSRSHEPSFHRSLVLLLIVLGVLLWGPLSVTAMPPPEQASQTAPSYDELCGDWSCGVTENCYNCPDDCGYCYEYCGDGICQSTESCSDCSYDCGSCSENRSVVVNGKRYWADYAGNAIWRSNLDGSQVELVHSVNGPYGIGYDPAAGTLIWTSSTDETVQAAAVGGSVMTLTSSFEEYFAIAWKASGQTATATATSMKSKTAEMAAPSSTTSLSYSVIGNEVVKLTEDINTGAEQREVLLTLSSPDEVRGLTLSADGTALYLGDPVGRMSRKLNIATHAVEWLVFDDYSSISFSTLRSPEAGQ